MNANIILSIVITLIIVVPVIYLATAGKRKQKKTLCKFKDYAQSHALKLEECDCCERLIIGVDCGAKKLIFKQNSEDAQIVDICEIKTCTTKTSSEIVDGDYIDKLEMDIQYKDSKLGTKTLTFFTSENKLTMDDERHVLEKWQQKINSMLA